MQLLISALLALIVSAAPTAYPACLTDETGPDVAPCYWDASHQGNGQGTSFIWTGSSTVELHR